ncbi:hypothetical protein TI05_13675 [Achromatium sp. WMS3]|nr:hypothetical protein TI05_13675 [Achromatium sp. WMS3]
MVSLDTNVLIRILVDDPQAPIQTKQAREIAKQHRQVYITNVVQKVFDFAIIIIYFTLNG